MVSVLTPPHQSPFRIKASGAAPERRSSPGPWRPAPQHIIGTLPCPAGGLQVMRSHAWDCMPRSRHPDGASGSCSSLITLGHLLDYIRGGQLAFGENSGAFANICEGATSLREGVAQGCSGRMRRAVAGVESWPDRGLYPSVKAPETASLWTGRGRLLAPPHPRTIRRGGGIVLGEERHGSR
jgi:hypothetical protein